MGFCWPWSYLYGDFPFTKGLQPLASPLLTLFLYPTLLLGFAVLPLLSVDLYQELLLCSDVFYLQRQQQLSYACDDFTWLSSVLGALFASADNICCSCYMISASQVGQVFLRRSRRSARSFIFFTPNVPLGEAHRPVVLALENDFGRGLRGPEHLPLLLMLAKHLLRHRR